MYIVLCTYPKGILIGREFLDREDADKQFEERVKKGVADEVRLLQTEKVIKRHERRNNGNS